MEEIPSYISDIVVLERMFYFHDYELININSFLKKEKKKLAAMD
jgi:hypothetical protein